MKFTKSMSYDRQDSNDATSAVRNRNVTFLSAPHLLLILVMSPGELKEPFHCFPQFPPTLKQGMVPLYHVLPH
jgi:hypothetical protein